MGYDPLFAIVYTLALTLYAAFLVWALPAICAALGATIRHVWSAAQGRTRAKRPLPQRRPESLASMLAGTPNRFSR
jgi:hypothetical protein